MPLTLIEELRLDLMLSINESGPAGTRSKIPTKDREIEVTHPSLKSSSDFLTHVKVGKGKTARHYSLMTASGASETDIKRHFPNQLDKNGRAKRPKLLLRKKHNIDPPDTGDDRENETLQRIYSSDGHDDAVSAFHKKISGGRSHDYGKTQKLHHHLF